MSVFAPIKKVQSKVHYSQFIQTEDKPTEPDTKPAEPVNPTQPEAK